MARPRRIRRSKKRTGPEAATAMKPASTSHPIGWRNRYTRYSASTASTTTATIRAVVAMIAAEREPGSGPSSAAAGCGMSLIAPLFDDRDWFASRDRRDGHRLARHEPAARGHLGHDLDAARQARGVGHDRGQDGCLTPERQERVAVRAVV